MLILAKPGTDPFTRGRSPSSGEVMYGCAEYKKCSSKLISQAVYLFAKEIGDPVKCRDHELPMTTPVGDSWL